MTTGTPMVRFGTDAVRISGSGAPALFLHGVPDTSALWEDVIVGVEDRFHCFAPDLPGFGESELPEGFSFDLRAYGQHINRLVEACGIETPLTLVLHDWGAIFGLSFAAQFPDKVAAIVGASFPFSHLYRWHTWARIWQTPGLGELSMLMMNHPLFSHEIRRGSKNLDTATIRRMFASANRPTTKATILKLYRSAPPYAFTELQAELRRHIDASRIQLLWGDSDPYIPSHFGRQIPHERIVIVEGCGHWLPSEYPEAVIRTLTTILTDSLRGTSRELTSVSATLAPHQRPPADDLESAHPHKTTGVA
ncbi:alpha/beta hydrolase [Allohahella marinimesophila]|uniref:Alpha/beta hydrolase n=1 Tax=Allohahella marinimesophila TaxID=1054972 RepID=A0ABP7NLU7_9GAMM